MKNFFIVRGYKIVVRASSYLELLRDYLDLEEYHGLRLIEDWIENFDECECEDGESCYVCHDYEGRNVVFDNDDFPRFLKIPSELLNSEEAMAEWVWNNSNIIGRGDEFVEAEEITSDELKENTKNLMRIRGWNTLVDFGEFEVPDFYELENESIFKIVNYKIGDRKISRDFKIKDEL